MPVRRRKYFEKNEGLAKCISSAICAADLSVWRSSIFIRVIGPYRVIKRIHKVNAVEL